jgi:hypothetical protein
MASWRQRQLCCCKLGQQGPWQQQQDVCASAAQLLKSFLDVTPSGEGTGPALDMRTGGVYQQGSSEKKVQKGAMWQQGPWQQQQDVCSGAAELLKRLLDITPGGQCTGPAMK